MGLLDTELPGIWEELDEAREGLAIRRHRLINEWLASANRFLPLIKLDDLRLKESTRRQLLWGVMRE
jgi:hypothetical protein